MTRTTTAADADAAWGAAFRAADAAALRALAHPLATVAHHDGREEAMASYIARIAQPGPRVDDVVTSSRLVELAGVAQWIGHVELTPPGRATVAIVAVRTWVDTDEGWRLLGMTASGGRPRADS